MNPSRIVQLDADHPGFRDAAYRDRRDQIARLAARYAGTLESIPLARYTAAEHALWVRITRRLRRANARFAYREHREGMRALELGDRIPQLRTMSRRLTRATGFRMVPVEGLVAARAFLTGLADRVFLSTQYIRHASRPGFTPEPDIVHELIGHAPQLVNPVIAQITQEIGMGAKRADARRLRELERLYWFTIEYGVCREDGALKAYGAGNLSSFLDLERCVGAGVQHRPFRVRDVVRTGYDPTVRQPLLFVVDSFDAALREIRRFVAGAGGSRRV